MNEDCRRVSRKLSAFLDGELSDEDRASIGTHIAACGACAAELERMSAADAGVRQLASIEPSPFFAARVAAAARGADRERAPLLRFLRLPVPAMAVMVTFILVNLFTFTFNINAMESGPRRELTRKVMTQLARPASLINPVALARLCGECSKYMCLCMHEAGKKSMCPCKDCGMDKMREQAGAGETMDMGKMEENNVH